MRRALYAIGFVVLILVIPLRDLLAQPVLIFGRVVNNWPSIGLYFKTFCNGKQEFTLDETHFQVVENGVEMKDFYLWCPEPYGRSAPSVSLVFDISGSMAGDGITGAKAAGLNFVNMMDGVTDEAAVIAFSSSVMTLQNMTTIKPLLQSAINSLTAIGSSTNLYGGALAGVQEVINNGNNRCRGVVVITDGVHSTGSTTFQDVITLAQQQRIRVFMVALGITVNQQELRIISEQTGGEYFHTSNPDSLKTILENISRLIFQCWTECLIIYDSHCNNGDIRNIDLSVLNFCGTDSITQSRSYGAPWDPTIGTPMRISLPQRRVESDSLFELPVILDPPITGDSLRAATFVLTYDTSLLEFEGVVTDPTTVLEDKLIQFIPTPEGVEFTTGAVFRQAPSNVMMKLLFRTKTVRDITQTTVKFKYWRFTQGCYASRPDSTSITVFPAGTLAVEDWISPTSVLLRQNYPNPFNPSTMIEYELQQTHHTRLVVSDALGRVVRELVNERKGAGRHSAVFDANGLPSGVYLYRLEAGGKMLTKWMMVVK